MTETLLINILFLIFPGLLYLLYIEKYPNMNRRFLIILFGAVSMLLCMSFPIQLSVGFIFDFRYIPFTMAALYGGIRLAFPLYLVLNLYRFYIGGDGIFLSFLYATIFLVIVSAFQNKFIHLTPKLRILCTGAVSIAFNTFYMLSLRYFYDSRIEEFFSLAINAILIQFLGTVLISSLIEKAIENHKTREKYMETERLKVVSQLAASISHEIRNPLTVTNGFLQLVAKSKALDSEDRKFLDYSLQELNRAEGILRDFLSLAKPQAENMVTSDLKVEIDYIHNVMLPYAHTHNVEIDYHFDNKKRIRFDKNQLQQCFINLYKNGIESMKDCGGTLTVNVTQQKKQIVITIMDNGIGMAPEQLKQIGKPYYSTKTEGTGLGMMYVYSTINELQGTIDIKSEPNKGTTFRIVLPTY